MYEAFFVPIDDAGLPATLQAYVSYHMKDKN